MACTAHVLAAPVGNLTLPLQLWYSKKLQDHMTVASAASVAYAQAHGYEVVSAAMGWVYAGTPPSP